MSGHIEDHDVIEGAAAEWAVRVQGDALSADDLVRLTAWLEESSLHGAAFDRAVMLWADLDGFKDAGGQIIQLAPMRGARGRDAMRQPVRRQMIGAGIAAALAVAAVGVAFLALRPSPATLYETQKGEQRTLTLADGSVMSLNTATRVSVRLDGRSRKFRLEQGEVALKVVHDEQRPLELLAGDTRIVDIGTEFNVLRDGDSVRVAVKEGEVRMHNADLRAGETATRRDGAAAVVRTKAPADEAFAWQTRHAIYHDQSLADVARDLNRYFDTPLIVDADSGKLRLTAILTLDSETSVVGRLQDYLPLEARATESGVYLTRAADGGRGTEP